MPKVTIGMPLYNRAGVLRSTIQQVLEQTFDDFEFLIYNDGSKDGSAEIVKSFSDQRIIFFDKANSGPPHPINFILERARGEYVIILHDHDFFHPQLIELSVRSLEKYPEAGFVLQGSAWVDEDGVSNYREMLLDLPELNSGRDFGIKFLSSPRSMNSIFHACSMVRKSAYSKIGNRYDPAFGLYADGDVWLRLLYQFNFVYLNRVLFKFRTRETVGHFLNGKQFQIIDWIGGIQSKNIGLYWSDRPTKEKLEKNLKRRLVRDEIKLTFSFASRLDQNLYVIGLSRLANTEAAPPLVRFFSRTLLKHPVLTMLSARIVRVLNKTRKMVAVPKL